MAFYAISCLPGVDTNIQQKTNQLNCVQKSALITDLVVATAVLLAGIFATLQVSGVLFLGPFSGLGTIGSTAAYVMIGGGGGLIVLDSGKYAVQKVHISFQIQKQKWLPSSSGSPDIFPKEGTLASLKPRSPKIKETKPSPSTPSSQSKKTTTPTFYGEGVLSPKKSELPKPVFTSSTPKQNKPTFPVYQNLPSPITGINLPDVEFDPNDISLPPPPEEDKLPPLPDPKNLKTPPSYKSVPPFSPVEVGTPVLSTFSLDDLPFSPIPFATTPVTKKEKEVRSSPPAPFKLPLTEAPTPRPFTDHDLSSKGRSLNTGEPILSLNMQTEILKIAKLPNGRRKILEALDKFYNYLKNKKKVSLTQLSGFLKDLDLLDRLSKIAKTEEKTEDLEISFEEIKEQLTQPKTHDSSLFEDTEELPRTEESEHEYSFLNGFDSFLEEEGDIRTELMTYFVKLYLWIKEKKTDPEKHTERVQASIVAIKKYLIKPLEEQKELGIKEAELRQEEEKKRSKIKLEKEKEERIERHKIRIGEALAFSPTTTDTFPLSVLDFTGLSTIQTNGIQTACEIQHSQYKTLLSTKEAVNYLVTLKEDVVERGRTLTGDDHAEEADIKEFEKQSKELTGYLNAIVNTVKPSIPYATLFPLE